MENTKYKTYCEKALLSSLVNIYMHIINTAIIFNAMRLSYILKFEILAQIWKCKKNKNCGFGGNTERTGCRNTKLTLKNAKLFVI